MDFAVNPVDTLNMEEIICKNGKIDLPTRFTITKEKRTLIVRTPYSSKYERLLKNNNQIATQMFFRQKGKDKPYVLEGFVEIDDILFKVIEEKK